MSTKKHPIPGYETMLVAKTDMTDDQVNTLKERIKSIITSFEGEIIKLDDWGKRKLAYTVNNETRGHYILFVYTAKPGAVAEIERNLRIHESILRFLSVRLDQEFNDDKYKQGTYSRPLPSRRRREIKKAGGVFKKPNRDGAQING